eukprot:g2744.t1
MGGSAAITTMHHAHHHERVNDAEGSEAMGAEPNRSNHIDKKAVKELVLYMLFMIFFTVTTTRYVGTETGNAVYQFGNGLRDQLTGVEVHSSHSPSFGKTFFDVATAQELYHWMMNPLSAVLFSQNTFDGEWDTSNATGPVAGGLEPPGHVLGNAKIIGAVRVGQLRSKTIDCGKKQVPAELESLKFTCYGDLTFSCPGEFLAHGNEFCDNESVEPFGGNFTVGGVEYDGFVFDGRKLPPAPTGPGSGDGRMPDRTVQDERARWFSRFSTDHWHYYASPAFSIFIDPTQFEGPSDVTINGATGFPPGAQIFEQLLQAQYIDLQTRAVVVDLTVYQPDVDHVASVRMLADIRYSGAIHTEFDMEVVRLFTGHASDDNAFLVLEWIVRLFYFYYFMDEMRELWHDGARKYFSSFMNVLQLTNVALFVAHLGFDIEASVLVKSVLHHADVDPRQFYDFRPAVKAKRLSVVIQATNTFLNWMKLLGYLSISPTFGLLTDTLTRALPATTGFIACFFLMIFGFAQAHSMIFGPVVEGYSTLGLSMFSLTLALMGDFDFAQLRRADKWMGPFFFVIFVLLATIVLLNMLVAIITDAYAIASEEKKKQPAVNLFKDVSFAVLELVESVPVLGARFKASREGATRLTRLARETTQMAVHKGRGLQRQLSVRVASRVPGKTLGGSGGGGARVHPGGPGQGSEDEDPQGEAIPDLQDIADGPAPAPAPAASASGGAVGAARGADLTPLARSVLGVVADVAAGLAAVGAVGAAEEGASARDHGSRWHRVEVLLAFVGPQSQPHAGRFDRLLQS